MTEINLQTIQDIVNKNPNIEDLFMQMPKDLRLHGIRVAEYALTLYSAVLESEMNLTGKNFKKERSPRFKEYIYKSGMYHDIGIMCLPEDHHLRQENVTALDLENNVSHTLFGQTLVQCYEQQNKSEPDIFWQFLKDAVKMHHEKPDGAGFPEGIEMRQMPMASWIVSIAVIIDIYSAYTRSEHPFKEAYDKIMNYVLTNNLFEVEIILRICHAKLEKVFEAHVKETKIIVFDSLMVKHTSKSSMFFKYRKINNLDGKTVAFQALPVFFLKTQNELVYYEEIKAKLKEAKVLQSVFEFFLYEASDMRIKMNAYGYTKYMLQIPFFSEAFSNSSIAFLFDKWIKETGTNPEQYCFIVKAGSMHSPSKTLIDNLNYIKSHRVKLMLSEFTTKEPYKSEEIGISFDIIQAEPVVLDETNNKTKDMLNEIWESGTELQANKIDDDNYNEVLNNLKFDMVCGEYAGLYKYSSDILADCLTR